MSSLQAFLHPIEVENQKIVVSDRFVENGKPVEWEIRPITEKENNLIMKKCTKRDMKTGTEQFNRAEFAHMLAASAVVSPDLANAELQKHYGVLGEAELLKAMLYVGEFAILSDAVGKLSGLDKDINEDIEDIKNA
jgi:hypothetical protein